MPVLTAPVCGAVRVPQQLQDLQRALAQLRTRSWRHSCSDSANTEDCGHWEDRERKPGAVVGGKEVRRELPACGGLPKKAR